MSDPLLSLVAVGLLSITCQYLAYKVKLPAILPLLIVGIVVGPVFGVLNADDLFGNLLFPVVSLSVAIILFEGSLTLKFSDIAGHGNMVRNLCSIGVLVTWVVAATAAHYSLDISWQLSFLFGAIVTVTGPTVIVPMLRTVRPKTNLANILRWEGIVIDPIGALLAVLVFEFIVASQETAITHTLIAFGKTVGIGSVLGLASGYLLGLSIRKDWIPHYLLNTAVLTVILGVFAASNYVAHESGLLAVTISMIPRGISLWRREDIMDSVANPPANDEILNVTELGQLNLHPDIGCNSTQAERGDTVTLHAKMFPWTGGPTPHRVLAPKAERFSIAFFLDRVRFAHTFIRALYFLPFITTASAMAWVWRWFYQPAPTGAINSFLGQIGLTQIDFLKSTTWALPSIMVTAIWAGLGIVLIAAIGWTLFGQKLDAAALVGMSLILSGIVVINVFSGSNPH